jgi:hypothetical protein
MVLIRGLLLNLITGTHGQAAQNKFHEKQPEFQAGDADLTAGYKRFLDLFEFEALDKAGTSVDDQQLWKARHISSTTNTVHRVWGKSILE